MRLTAWNHNFSRRSFSILYNIYVKLDSNRIFRLFSVFGGVCTRVYTVQLKKRMRRNSLEKRCVKTFDRFFLVIRVCNGKGTIRQNLFKWEQMNFLFALLESVAPNCIHTHDHIPREWGTFYINKHLHSVINFVVAEKSDIFPIWWKKNERIDVWTANVRMFK